MARKVPRPFRYEWGSGEIVEEATATNPHYEPVIQLLRYTAGEADGQESVRFCFYSPRGAFQRHPLLVGPDEIAQLRESLKATPRLRALLKELVAD